MKTSRIINHPPRVPLTEEQLLRAALEYLREAEEAYAEGDEERGLRLEADAYRHRREADLVAEQGA